MEFNIKDQELISYHLGDASVELVDKINIWLGSSEDNRLNYSKVSKIMTAVDGLRDFKKINTSNAWERMQTIMDTKN